MLKRLLITVTILILSVVLVLPAVASHRQGNNPPPAQTEPERGPGKSKGGDKSASAQGCYPPGKGQGAQNSPNRDC